MIYLNLGRREVGKTTLAAYLIAKSRMRIVFDPRGLFPASRRATTPEEIAFSIDAYRRGDAYASPEIVITPDVNVQACFDRACLEVKDFLRDGGSDIALLIDELRFVHDTDGPDLNWVLRCATRDSVTVVFTAHRPVDVTTDIRAISDVWCVFQMTQENDLKVITERCSPAVAQLVAKLPPRHFVSWNDANGRMSIHSHPERWYVPLRVGGALIESKGAIDSLDGEPFRADGKFDFSK